MGAAAGKGNPGEIGFRRKPPAPFGAGTASPIESKVSVSASRALSGASRFAATPAVAPRPRNRYPAMPMLPNTAKKNSPRSRRSGISDTNVHDFANHEMIQNQTGQRAGNQVLAYWMFE